jgi:serine/threonine protein kinase
LATVADDPNYLFVRCGTPGYVAPEIINIKDMSTKSQPISDVFSVGCIFHYIIFSKHLFMGKNAQEIIAMNRECDIVLTGPEFDKLNQKGIPSSTQRSTSFEKCCKNSPNYVFQLLRH